MSLFIFILSVVAIADGLVTKPTIVRSVSDCSIDTNGFLHYHGTHALTNFNQECLPWSDLQTVYPGIINEPNFFEDVSIQQAKNYCRNPNKNVDGPWCFVQVTDDFAIEQCAVCQSLATTPTLRPDQDHHNDDNQTTPASVDRGFWETLRDELKRVGAYIRDKFLQVVGQITAKFRKSG